MAYVKDATGCDLLDKLLQLDPQRRCDADAALDHDFFWTDPAPADLANMLSHHQQSMFDYLTPQRRTSHRPYHQMNPNRAQDSLFDRVY